MTSLCIEAARCVLTGQRSAKKKLPGRAGGGKSPLTKIYKDKFYTITPEVIGYIACLVSVIYLAAICSESTLVLSKF